MSFGFGVGDFIAVGELCWKIYTRVYKVSRDAPEELRALIQELGNFSNTVNLLNEEVRDKEEWIKRAGERRLEYTCKIMGQAKETLEKMDRLADKYAELDPGANSRGSRRSFRIQWNRVKYAFEVSSINELRAKFMSHNLHLTLLLQGAQNSSLERIEKQQTKTDIMLEELRNVMIGDRRSRESPLLKGPLDEEALAELSAAFLKSAETDNRPWASIGIDDWLQAGKWWLLKARSQMDRLADGTEIKFHAYINLLKSYWILTEIVSIHPQRTHLGASNDRRNDDIRNLSQIAKASLKSFPVFDFQLRDVEDYTITIWPQSRSSSTITPRRQFTINHDRPNVSWKTSDGEILFQCFAKVQIAQTFENFEKPQKVLEECFLMLEVPQKGIYLNFILQNFAGQDICKLKLQPGDGRIDYDASNSDVLNAILWGFQLFGSAFHPASLSVSMVHSVSVLANWPSRNWQSLLLPGYDIGCPSQSDSPALLLRAIIIDLAEKGCQDKISGSKFLAKDLSVELPPGYCAWKVICWHCEKFADIKPLFKEFNVRKDLHGYLIQTAFLRLDRSFLNQLACYRNYGDRWRPDDILIMVEAALSSDDAGYLLWILEHVAASVISGHRIAILQLVYNSRRLSHIDTMIQVVIPRPADIAAAVAWYLVSSDEQSFGGFLQLIEDRGGSFSSKTAEEVDFSDFYPTFVAGCGHLMESKCSNTLGLYLSSFERLGIDFHGVQGHKKTDSSQWAILPALLSPDPSFLRILLEREVVVADMEPFIVEYNSWTVTKCPPRQDLKELVQYPPSSMPHWPLYCAVMLVCDTEFLHVLCQHGASLQQERRGTQDQKSETQGIIHHLSSLSSVLDARLEYMDTLMFCHILIHVGTLGKHSPLRNTNHFSATDKTTDYEETWRCMERLLYRDSFFSDCLCPCGYTFKGDWKKQPDTRSKLMSRYAEFPDHYSKHLRTQASWDTWRRDSLQILSK
ncbi:hypothetical protein HZ326_16645 [Fusarium oxysporum f. sp. albedinis]|nr:hypothetical protein HZ326_16645 [Fusarium oxysporum f. sp. albedinis]